MLPLRTGKQFGLATMQEEKNLTVTGEQILKTATCSVYVLDFVLKGNYWEVLNKKKLPSDLSFTKYHASGHIEVD